MSFFSRIFYDKRTKPQDVAQEPQAVVGAPTQEYMRLQDGTLPLFMIYPIIGATKEGIGYSSNNL